jgi:uncharacterized protein
MMSTFKSEERDGMRIDWDVPIEMSDGNILRADVFRPIEDGRYPAIMTHGPYGKGLAMQDGYRHAWERIIKEAPEVLEGSTNKYQNWEVVDPEKWVPNGYVVIRVDSRGSGRSPGYIDAYSKRETRDFHECIEWAGVQEWSNGKVGLNGISYYAISQWQVAQTRPPHLAAICVWEGCSDTYRDATRHGGIMCSFRSSVARRQINTTQYGVGDRGPKSRVTGENVSGGENLSDEQLMKNRRNVTQEVADRPLIDAFYEERTPKLENIEVPLLSAANWGGMGLHTRGNFVGWEKAGSQQKWLEVHGDSHFTPFYRQEGEDLQKRFLGHFLKGEDTGWDKQPPVLLNIRHPGETFVPRAEQEWPLARTQWTKFHLQPDGMTFGPDETARDTTLDYDTTGEGLAFSTGPMTEDVEITGPIAARLTVSSRTADADLFLVLRLFDPEGKEVTFIGSNDPRVPIALGWLRASHRKLDPEQSRPYRPWHTHDETWPLTPGDPVTLDIEIWPTCIVVLKGYSLELMVRGKDFEREDDANVPFAPYEMKGIGAFHHRELGDRPAEIFETVNTLHFGKDAENYLLMPIIPQS